MCRGESHFSQKWPLANVGESGESSQNGLAKVGESGEYLQNGSANVGKSGESREYLSPQVIAKVHMIRYVFFCTNNIFYMHKTV
jgi:hypothetical protein